MKAGVMSMCLGVAMLVGAAGCGSGTNGEAAATPGAGVASAKIASYCAAATACEGGNARDQAACNDKGKAAEAVAGDYDCSAAWNTVLDCMVAHSTCVPNLGGRSNYVAVDPNTKFGTCDAQTKALSDCENTASAYN
jgi:hypothetical protein